MKYKTIEIYRKGHDLCIHSQEVYDIIFDILDRMEEINDVEMYNALDCSLMYTKDQWSIVEEYCTPMDCNWSTAIELFINDLYSILECIS